MLKCIVMRATVLLAAVSNMALISIMPALASDAPTLSINNKTITGTLEPDNYVAYRGVRYAKPPVGELRWMPPVANDTWADQGTFAKYEATCATKDTLGFFGKTSNTEDCLFANVFLPAKRSSDGPYPVLVWVHGGGLSTGSGNDYNPAFLTDRGIAVVTFNYRVGSFGFFSDEALDDSNAKAGKDSINYGFMDQQEVLRWVRNNIAAFGGDPNNVTIAGESAGGSSMFSHMISPGSKGLFHKVIASSGSDSMNDFDKYLQRKIFAGPIIKNTPCKDKQGADRVGCLRGLTTQQMLDFSTSYLAIGKIVTGTPTMPLTIASAFTSGQFHQVPLITGANHDEGMLFAWTASDFTKTMTMTKDQFLNAIPGNLGPVNAEKVFKRTIPPGDGNYYSLGVRLLGDARFVCRTPLIGQLASRYTPTYLYLFSPTNPPMYFNPGFNLFAAHTSDLAYMFKDFAGGLGYPAKLSPVHQKLSSAMMDSYAAFMRTGKPGPMNGETWTPMSNNQQQFMSLQDESQKMQPDFSAAKHCLEPDIALVLDSPYY